MSLPYFLTPCDHPQHEQLWVEAQKTIARLRALVSAGREMAEWIYGWDFVDDAEGGEELVRKWRILEGEG